MKTFKIILIDNDTKIVEANSLVEACVKADINWDDIARVRIDGALMHANELETVLYAMSKELDDIDQEILIDEEIDELEGNDPMYSLRKNK